MNRVDQLIALLVEQIGKNKTAIDLNVREQRDPDLIFLCVMMWTQSAISLALLHWGKGDIGASREAFADCVAAHELAEMHRKRLGGKPERVRNSCWSVLSAYLLNRAPASERPLLADPPLGGSGEGYEPWFNDFFADVCTYGLPLDLKAYETSKTKWKKRRFPAAREARWDFYAEVLSGTWSARPAEMLARHEEVYRLQRKIVLANIETGDGEYNDYVPDILFAAILKRIDWRGECRHAWPG